MNMSETRIQHEIDMLQGEEPILKFFSFAHLRTDLRPISEPFAVMAVRFVMRLPRSERTAGLRKLLEAKDCIVRASLP